MNRDRDAQAPFEPTGKRRRGFSLASPASSSSVKHSDRIVGIDTELVEKLGRNDPCPCGSGRRFPPLLLRSGPVRPRSRAITSATLTSRDNGLRKVRPARLNGKPSRAD